jgi:hypothetical protein
VPLQPVEPLSFSRQPLECARAYGQVRVHVARVALNLRWIPGETGGRDGFEQSGNDLLGEEFANGSQRDTRVGATLASFT